MAYTEIDDPTIYFNTKLYTGNNTGQSITGVGFQPDWVWIKSRTDTNSHNSWDSVRGVNKYLENDTTKVQTTVTNGVTAFGTDGFTVGDRDAINDNGLSLVSWNWKAGGSASSNSNGSVTTSVSANTTAGFSVVNVPTTGSVLTAGHGLSQAPEIIFEKSRDKSDNWIVYNYSIGNTKALFLNLANANSTATDFFNDTSPTSTVWTMGSENSVNNASQETIAYCFHSVKGYSRISNYVGNGATNGPVVYCGFKPAWVLIKNVEVAEQWRIYDNKRDPFNHMFRCLFPNANNGENTTDNQSEEIDFLATGFKIRSDSRQLNGSGQKLIYMAFAEAPLVTGASAIPTTAR